MLFAIKVLKVSKIILLSDIQSVCSTFFELFYLTFEIVQLL